MNINALYQAIISQNEKDLRNFFHKEAYINWHCTNERFTLDEYIIANCEYPGDWGGKIERIETMGDIVVVVAHVHTKDRSVSYHVTSFIKIMDDKIISMDEYWATDETPPRWRADKHLGTKIY